MISIDAKNKDISEMAASLSDVAKGMSGIIRIPRAEGLHPVANPKGLLGNMGQSAFNSLKNPPSTNGWTHMDSLE